MLYFSVNLDHIGVFIPLECFIRVFQYILTVLLESINMLYYAYYPAGLFEAGLILYNLDVYGVYIQSVQCS